jgi:DtxR family Mn-dependent transcriptional regulator
MERVLIEDALKHLYDQEYNEVKCTLSSISGSLGISRDQAARLLQRLESLGLTQSREEGFELTNDGRSYALRMIRIHRLWERYLADETGLSEIEWHKKAELLEHRTSDEESAALAARMGNPTYDPHGDPIPTESGDLPPKKGTPLTDLAEGSVAQIIHIEDEPKTVYAQLVAEGLHPGMRVHLLSKNEQRIVFATGGDEIVLAPVFANNVSVEPLPEQKITEPQESLAQLEIGDVCRVVGISNACRGQQRRRIMDLGVIPGTIISAEMQSLTGDPTAYNIRGAVIALRKTQAEQIHIKRIKEAA